MNIKEIQSEREDQKQKFDEKNDDLWTPAEWAALMSHYATRQMVGDLHRVSLDKFRADCVKVAALAVACIEAIDRKGS